MIGFLHFWADVHAAISAGLNLVAEQFEPWIPTVEIYPPADEYVGHHTVVE
jgi:hypothetical protein